MNKNFLKQWLLENRIFGGLNNFLHQHRSVVYSVRTSCESSKHTGVKVQEFRIECSVIFFQMSNHFSFIGAHHNCIWIIGIIKFAFEKNFLSMTHSHVIIIPTSDSEFLSKDVPGFACDQQYVSKFSKGALTLFLPPVHGGSEVRWNMFSTFPDVVGIEGSHWSYLKAFLDFVKYLTHVFGIIFDVLEAIWTKKSSI